MKLCVARPFRVCCMVAIEVDRNRSQTLQTAEKSQQSASDCLTDHRALRAIPRNVRSLLQLHRLEPDSSGFGTHLRSIWNVNRDARSARIPIRGQHCAAVSASDGIDKREAQSMAV